MDLQYCDQCGSILQNRLTDPAKPGAVVICEVCKTSPIGEPSASAAAAAETTVRDSASPGVKVTLKEATNTSAPTATMQGEDLTLFSTETIARRKAQVHAEEVQQSKPRIKIVEGQSEHSSRMSRSMSTGDAPVETATSVGFKASATSTALPRAPEKATGPRQRQLNIIDEAEGKSGAPNMNQARWKVECPGCASRLAIKPLEKRSRMNCPRCHGLLVIELDGKVSIRNEDGAGRDAPSGSEVVSQLSRLLRSGPGSTAASKPTIAGSVWSALPMAEPATTFERAASRAVSKSGSVAVRADAEAPAASDAAKPAAAAPLVKPQAAPSSWESKGAGLPAEKIVFGVLVTMMPTLLALIVDHFSGEPRIMQFIEKVGTQLQADIVRVTQWLGL